MSLAELAQARLAMNLPTFPGASLAEQLVNGRNAALASLRKYVPDFAFDEAAADAALRHIDAWSQRNEEALSAAMVQAGNDLPATIQTELGPGQAQAFVLATFTKAAVGLGPWYAGEIDRLATTPNSQLGPAWAAEDAAHRLQVFGSIVRMDEEGRLAQMFAAASSANGLGVAWFIPVIIGVVALAAVVLTFVAINNRVQANNAIMRDLCLEAQKRGDQKTVAACVEATRDLQQLPLEGAGNTLIKVALVLGLIYVGVRYGLPWLKKIQDEKRPQLEEARA